MTWLDPFTPGDIGFQLSFAASCAHRAGGISAQSLNSPSAQLAALGSRMPFWDRDIDLVIVPSADAKPLNGLMAEVDRYQVGQIVSVEVRDNRAGREWLDMIAAKEIDVIESELGIGIEDGIDLTLSDSGWVQIDAGATSVGIGTPGS